MFDGKEVTPPAGVPAHAPAASRAASRSRGPFHSMTVLENLLVPLGLRGPPARQRGRARRRWRSCAASASRTRRDALANQLSQVELRKLELARAMAARPRLLISDEAMAGLSGAEVDEVLKILFDLNARDHHHHVRQ